MAMTAWSAKVSRRSNLLIGERARFLTANQDRARSALSLAQARNSSVARWPSANSHLPALGKLVAFEKVGDMNGSCFEHRTTGHPVVGEWLSLPEGSTERTGMRKRDHRIPVAAENCRVQRLAETHSSPDNRVQDRLDVGRRAADRSKDSGRARLLLQSLRSSRVRASSFFSSIAGDVRQRALSPSFRSNEGCDRWFGSSRLCETRSPRRHSHWSPSGRAQPRIEPVNPNRTAR